MKTINLGLKEQAYIWHLPQWDTNKLGQNSRGSKKCVLVSDLRETIEIRYKRCDL